MHQDGRRPAARLVVGSGEEAAQLRLNAQQREDISRRLQRQDPLRLAAAGDVNGPRAPQSDAFERPIFVALSEIQERGGTEVIDPQHR
jgi:hypothetical protein